MDPIKRPARRRDFVVFDIESKKDDTQEGGFSRPFLVGFYDGKEYKAFRNDASLDRLPWKDRCIAPGGCVDKAMRHLLGEAGVGGRYSPAYRDHDAYAHNMGAFDGLFLPAWLQKNRTRWSFKLTPVQARIMTMEIWRHVSGRPRTTEKQRRESDRKDRKLSGFIRILDSYKVMPVSLDKVIKMFKLNEDESGKFDMDLDTHESDARWEEYNRDDCVKLWQAMGKYQELILSMGGDVGITAPATAMKLLRMKYLDPEEKVLRNIHFADCPWDDDKKTPGPEVPFCDGCAHAFFRTAYHGGRTEIYRGKGNRLSYYDINSSYPTSMKEPQPIGSMIILGPNEDFTEFATSSKFIGFIRATVTIPKTTYLPPLPLPMGGKLKFPAGIFSGTWDWAELSQIFRVGGKILHVEKSVWIAAKRFMVPFVNGLYLMRDKKSPTWDAGRDETAKIMMNSTFGKYGMEQDRLEIVILKPGESIPRSTRNPKESRTTWRKRIGKETDEDKALRTPDFEDASSALFEHASTVRYRDVHVDAPYIIPQIAAHITSTARLRLWDLDMAILERGGQIFYGDTDSVLTDLDDLPESSELGGMKKEFKGEKLDLVCFAPKMYLLKKSDPDAEPFAGEHLRKPDGKPVCDKKCKGCSREKIMMKGVPKDMKTMATVETLLGGGEISFRMHEKLGALARRDLMDTPMMVSVKKSLRSKYDKRIELPDGNTRPIVIGDDIEAAPYLSDAWKDLGAEYQVPEWLAVVAKEVRA